MILYKQFNFGLASQTFGLVTSSNSLPEGQPHLFIFVSPWYLQNKSTAHLLANAHNYKDHWIHLLVLLTPGKNKPIICRKSETIPFSLSFIPGFSESADCYDYVQGVLRDKKIMKNLTFHEQLPVEWPSKLLPGQVCHLHTCTCTADNL